LKKRLNKRPRTSKKDMDAMVESFEGGERITIEQFIQKFFAPKSPYAYLVAKKRALSFLHIALKRRFNQLGKDFGVINTKGQYGVPLTKEEVVFRITNYYTFSKALNQAARRAVSYATEENLLPAMVNERIALPKVA